MQRSFDDLGTPLSAVTFVVVDLETTGGSPGDDAITEIGAVKLRGGECLGTFSTLVNPGRDIPPTITFLTGITHAMVVAAPRIDSVLPAFLEFLGTDAVIVGHNIRFDLAFLDAAIRRHGSARLALPSVDTCGLARRLVRDEVPNCKLSTLAERFRLGHRPTHRALDDALATGDLLHVLLERAGSLGVLGLDDLLALPTIAGHPQLAKLRLTDDLPRAPGVYLFRDAGGRVLYVGKAANLRTRVRSYFSGDERRKIGQLLRETHAIDHIVAPGPLEAAVLEVRLIHEHLPRFNRQAKTWRRYAYLKLTLNERFPRLSVVKAAKDDGALYLGPLPTSTAARRIAEAIESSMPLRRCTKSPPKTPLAAPCAPAQLGVSLCPCAAAVTDDAYAAVVGDVVRALTVDATPLLAPLEARMHDLAALERFEEATDVRERASALSSAIRRQRRLDALRRAGRVIVEVPGRGGVELDDGLLVRSWTGSQPPLTLDIETYHDESSTGPLRGWRSPLPRHLADEVAVVAAWLEREASRVRLVSCSEELTSLVGRLPRFEPRPSDGSERTATKVLLRSTA